jgi:uncharacterized protein (TIGR03067 family)
MSLSTLEGCWQLLRAELAGEAAPSIVSAKTELRLTADTYEVWFEGRIVDRGRYEADDTAPVRTLVLHGLHGTNAGRMIPCLYQLAGDRLRVCYGLDGVTPDAMITRAGDQRYLATYARKKAG